jgi:hypothetical protein
VKIGILRATFSLVRSRSTRRWIRGVHDLSSARDSQRPRFRARPGDPGGRPSSVCAEPPLHVRQLWSAPWRPRIATAIVDTSESASQPWTFDWTRFAPQVSGGASSDPYPIPIPGRQSVTHQIRFDPPREELRKWPPGTYRVRVYGWYGRRVTRRSNLVSKPFEFDLSSDFAEFLVNPGPSYGGLPIELRPAGLLPSLKRDS